MLTSVAGTRALGYVKRGVELGRPDALADLATLSDRAQMAREIGGQPSACERLAEGDDVGPRAHGGELGGLVDDGRQARRRDVPPSAAARSQATAVSSSPSAPAARAIVAASSGCGSRGVALGAVRRRLAVLAGARRAGWSARTRSTGRRTAAGGGARPSSWRSAGVVERRGSDAAPGSAGAAR